MNLLYKKANVSTMDTLGELWGKGQEKAYDAWQTAGDELSSLGGKAKEKAGDVMYTAKSPVRTMKNFENASETLESASKNVEDGVNKGKKAIMIGGGIAGAAALTGLGVLGYKNLKNKSEQHGEKQQSVSGRIDDGNRPVPRRIGADGVPAKMAPIIEQQKPRIPIDRVAK